MTELTTIPVDPIQRDRWGRPLIIPADGGTPIAYVRASSVGKAIEDTYYLSLWQQRQVLRGACADPSLLLRVEHLGDEPDRGDETAFKAWKSALDELVQDCHKAIGSHDRADLGTTMHTVFEAAALGQTLPEIPAGCEQDVDAWRVATEGWRWLALERFVVNDRFQVAGTLDGLVLRQVAGHLVVQVADWKTGRSLEFNGLGYAAQVATYTDSLLYDPLTGARSPLTSLVAEHGIDPATVRLDTDTALLVHSPAGEGRCDIYTVPLDRGRAAVAMAMDVRAMRTASKRWLSKVGSHGAPAPVAPSPQPAEVAPTAGDDTIASLLASATTQEELAAIWRLYASTPEWTPAHVDLGNAQFALIKGGLVAAAS